MSSSEETGHARNAGNFDIMVTSCTAQGENYKPSNALILLAAIVALNKSAKDVLELVNTALGAYKKVAGIRVEKFEPLNPLLTRVSNALKSCGTSKTNVNTGLSMIKKIKGIRISHKLTDEEKQALEAEGKELTQISAAQTGYDNKLNNFDGLIKFLETVEEYKPNDAGLSVAELKAYYGELNTANTNAHSAGTALSNARISRDEILYTQDTGLVDVAGTVKEYFISAFGARSTNKFRNLDSRNGTRSRGEHVSRSEPEKTFRLLNSLKFTFGKPFGRSKQGKV